MIYYLAAELTEVLAVLADLHLLNLLPDTRSITSSCVNNHTYNQLICQHRFQINEPQCIIQFNLKRGVNKMLITPIIAETHSMIPFYFNLKFYQKCSTA